MSFVGANMYAWIVFVFVFTVDCGKCGKVIHSRLLGDRMVVYQRSYNRMFYCNSNYVNLPQGRIQGTVSLSENGKEFYSYQEIPYAAPPVGELRFKEPHPPVSWSHIKLAFPNTKVCMQTNETALTHVPEDMIISEDCLYLNVYTPQNPSSITEKLPVLFYIHGGGFFYGSGARQYHDPKYLMDYDIVVVTMNYRLGPFGFLTTTDDIIPGNLGLKDQLYALKWTVRNIHLFGGDPEKITVAGLSAGATSAGFMQLSKTTEGLVRGYILQSGSPISPFAYQDEPREYAFKLGKILNKAFDSDDSRELLKLLLSKPAKEIQAAQVQNVGYMMNPIGALAIWLPVVENPSNANPYITEPMVESLESGKFNKVPLLTGTTSEEAMYFLRYLTDPQLAYFKNVLDSNLNLTIHPRLNINPQKSSQAAKEYKEIYTKKNFTVDAAAYVKYIGEDVFSTPNIHHAALASYKAPAYLYEFSYKGKMGGLDVPEIPGANNVGHTEDLHYLFGGAEGVTKPISSYPEEDRRTMKKMLTLWTNFIKYLNPTPAKDEVLDNVTWPKVDPGESMNFLNINKTLKPLVNPKYYKQIKPVFDKYARPPNYVF